LTRRKRKPKHRHPAAPTGYPTPADTEHTAHVEAGPTPTREQIEAYLRRGPTWWRDGGCWHYGPDNYEASFYLDEAAPVVVRKIATAEGRTPAEVAARIAKIAAGW
jgi:hypothetical protein